ncbi:hypothetical protein K474DRAFT_1662793 [Panus rudis PR-1116 ss-1]|nr:hypothetical protein K474DRAFT_1662793 [Panus rudis PR-1116 ss-1]
MLRHDKWSVVMNLLSKGDLLSLMHTSRGIHELGLPVLLGLPLKLLPSGTRFFCELLNKDISRYAPMLRDIRLPYVEDSKTISEAVTCLDLPKVMKYAINLRSLRVLNSQDVVAACPDFASSLHSLPKLEQLWFDDLSQSIYDELASGPWPLTHLYLRWCLLDINTFDIVPIIAHLAETLQVLDVEYIDFHKLASSEHIFPRMRTLTVGQVQVDDWAETGEIALAFPNIRSFSVIHDFNDDFLDDCEQQRDNNELDAASVRPYHWEELDEINMPFNVLYALNVRCTTQCLFPTSPSVDNYMPVHPEALVNCHPTAMMMNLKLCAELFESLSVVWSNAPQLTHLSYTFPFGEACTNAEAEELTDLLRHFIDTHKFAPCTHLCLVFTFPMNGGRYNWTNLFEKCDIGVADAAGLAQRLVDVIPGLELIDIQGHQRTDSSEPLFNCWMGKVVTTEEGRKVVKSEFERTEIFDPGLQHKEWDIDWYSLAA